MGKGQTFRELPYQKSTMDWTWFKFAYTSEVSCGLAVRRTGESALETVSKVTAESFPSRQLHRVDHAWAEALLSVPEIWIHPSTVRQPAKASQSERSLPAPVLDPFSNTIGYTIPLFIREERLSRG